MDGTPLGDDDADVDDVYGPARVEGERGQMGGREGGGYHRHGRYYFSRFPRGPIGSVADGRIWSTSAPENS